MDTVEVQTSDGAIRGVKEQGLAIFRGVPYAQPPTGSLRFRPPAPLKLRSEVLDTIAVAPVCPQSPSRLVLAMGECPAEQDENCLTITVWAPLPFDRPRPILVWFHGGGYLSGGGSLPWYDGSTLARENDIVVVGVNSRLGALGYLFRPGLNAGNMGLQDQIEALEWIARNARSFGGDAQRVTSMGQSGGAHSIVCMLAIPAARHLMQQVILLSMPYALRPFSAEESTTSANLFCEKLGVDADQPDVLARMQSLPVSQIVEATFATLRGSKRPPGDPTPPFGPSATGDLPGGEGFDTAVQAGASRISAIVGSTADEARAFYAFDPRFAGLTFDVLPRVAEPILGKQWHLRLDRARRERPGATALEVLTDAQTRHYFTDGVEQLALAVAGGTGKAWAFRFDWQAPQTPFGACHCIELPFVFGTFEAFAKAPMLGAVDDKQRALSAVVRGAVASFVEEGAPAGNSSVTWPRFSRSTPVFLQINSTLSYGWMDLNF